MARPILRTSIPGTGPGEDEPPDAALRAETYRALAGDAEGWPVRLTYCGEHPGVFGDNLGKFRPVGVTGAERPYNAVTERVGRTTRGSAPEAASGELSGQ